MNSEVTSNAGIVRMLVMLFATGIDRGPFHEGVHVCHFGY